MSSKVILTGILMVFLAGCSSEEFKKADGKILCDPETDESYLVQHRIGDTSFVSPIPEASKVCLP